jgi:hypothetical protein
MSNRSLRLRAIVVLCLTTVFVHPSAVAAPETDPAPAPRAVCGPGSRPEPGRQGRVTQQDVESGRAAKGFTCNAELVSHFGEAGGYKVFRYVDKAGHECAFFDPTLLFPTNVQYTSAWPTGVDVLDMSDPAHPKRTDTLMTAAMQTPHESLSFNARRGLLAADTGNPVTYPGFVDVYDASADCRQPVVKTTMGMGVLGHEGAFAPDGRTFYATSVLGSITAIDVTDPSVATPVWWSRDYSPHGLSVSDDGNRLYIADRELPGMTIIDVSEVQRRVPNAQTRILGQVTWPTVTVPQVTIPVTIKGRRFVIEIDEFAKSDGQLPSSDAAARVGAARIIDIADERHPKVISDIRLEVNQRRNRASQMDDPGADSSLQGYAGHYCAVPSRREPGIVACSFILSGLRVFDIRDPYHPREVAYFNKSAPGESQFAMSAPAFAPERREIWYTDGNSGFYAVRLTNGAWPAR